MAEPVLNSIASSPLRVINFTFINVLNYCELLNKTHGCKNNYNSVIIKGQGLFKDNFVTNIEFAERELDFIVRARVKAEMRKTVVYTVYAYIGKDFQVIKASCMCPGGVEPACCKHTFGLLAAIEDYSRKELYSAPTEKLQTWHQPKPVKVSPKKLTSAPCNANVDTSVDFSALPGSFRPIAPIYSVINNNSSITNLITDVLFYERTIPLPAFVSPTLCEISIPFVLDFDCIAFYHEHIRKPIHFFNELEFKTMSQSCDTWHSERNKRITASNICSILNSTDLDNTCKQLLQQQDRDISHLPPIKLGRKLEPMVKNMIRAKFQHHIFRNTGLTIHPIYPFIGSSPDGLLYNSEDPMLVEIKVVFNLSKLSLPEICNKRKDFYLSYNQTTKMCSLKPTHKYYFQIQCQLFCSNLNKCLLAVFFDFRKPLFFQVINAVPNFWDDAKLSKLKNFYFRHYMPKYIHRK